MRQTISTCWHLENSGRSLLFRSALSSQLPSGSVRLHNHAAAPASIAARVRPPAPQCGLQPLTLSYENKPPLPSTKQLTQRRPESNRNLACWPGPGRLPSVYPRSAVSRGAARDPNGASQSAPAHDVDLLPHVLYCSPCRVLPPPRTCASLPASPVKAACF